MLPSPASTPRALYKQLWRTASHFKDYNFRHYAHRNIQQRFREHASESDPAKISALMERGQKDLKMLQRQTLINYLYSPGESLLNRSDRDVPRGFSLQRGASPQDSFAQWANGAALGAGEAHESSSAQHKEHEQQQRNAATTGMPEN